MVNVLELTNADGAVAKIQKPLKSTLFSTWCSYAVPKHQPPSRRIRIKMYKNINGAFRISRKLLSCWVIIYFKRSHCKRNMGSTQSFVANDGKHKRVQTQI